MFLAVTPIEEFWDKNDDLLFIGPWCALYDRRANWSGLRHRFLPDPWLDFGRFKSAADYCQKSASRLLTELTGYLNKIHGTDHDERYWRLLLDPWLTYYIEQMYDHFVHVEDAFRLEPGLRTTLLDPDCYETPRDTADFVRLKLGDRFHLQMFSHIIAARGAGFPTRRLPPFIADASPPGGLKAFVMRAAAPVLRALTALGAGRMLLSELGLTRSQLLRLVLRSGLKALPHYAELPDSARPAPLMNERRLGLGRLPARDEFEKVFVAGLPRHLPTIFLEGYAEARRATLASLPRAPKIVFSSLGWHYADPFKFAAAECAARGSRLWGIQHGNSYGMNEFMPAERFERAVCDRYFAWGWAKTDADPRLRDLPSPFLSEIAPASPGRDLLYVSMIFDLHNMRLIRDSNGSGAVNALERQARFLRALPEPARDRALVRLYRRDAGWRHRDRLVELFPEARFDDASVPFGRRMREARLIIVDYPSTPMVEAFVADVPCLVTWAPDTWTVRPSAQPFLDALRKTGILIDSPEDAAAAAARAYENPRAWWDEPARPPRICAHLRPFRSGLDIRLAEGNPRRARGVVLKTLPYGRQLIDAADRAAVDKVLRSPWLTQGPSVAAFEDALAAACGAKYAVACANGTAALHLACLAAGLKPGDEAVVPAITFAATANAALYCGAEPVIVDVLPDTVTLDPAAFAKAITRRTQAVLPVHFAGLPADMKEISRIARAKGRGILIIEDAAHALGASYRGKKIGACDRSDMAILSFHPVKHVATGEGGAVLTNRKDLRDRLRLFRSHGITRDEALLEDKSQGGWYYEMQMLGFNYRITDILSALGVSQLKKLPRFLKRRRQIARLYTAGFAGDARIKMQALPADREHAWHLFTIQVPAERRRALYDFLHAQGILANVHYIPLHRLPFYKRRGWAKKRLPVAEAYYAGALSLPMHAALSDADVRRVIAAVRKGLDLAA